MHLTCSLLSVLATLSASATPPAAAHSAAAITLRTVDDAPVLTPLESAVLDELNTMRADPVAYAQHLEALRPAYRGVLLFPSAGGVPVKTAEGVAALAEAVAVLRNTAPLGALTASAALAFAARDHVDDQGPTGSIGHRGTDGSTSLRRISRYGRSAGLSAEVIDYGWQTARDIVIDLLIDDGVPNRGHRNSLLRPQYVLAGAACGPHERYGTMCVVEVAEDFAALGSSAPARRRG